MRELRVPELLEGRKKINASQLIVLVSVLALHLAIVALFLVSPRIRLAAPPASPMELIYLPTIRILEKPPALVAASKKVNPIRSDAITLLPTAPQAPGATPSPDSGKSAPTIDWSLEAQTVASEVAKRDTGMTPNEPSQKSPFRAPPEHHLGDEFVTSDGGRAVYVSKNCYQVSKTFTEPSNAISNGMGVQTYCKRSKGWIDNLFDAFKK